MSIPEHLEKYLGKGIGGWSFSEGPADIGVVSFPDQPFAGVTTLVTLGLSHHLLHLPNKPVRQELLFGFHSSYDSSGLSKLLHFLSEQILQNHHAPLCGDILALGGPIVSGSDAENLYAYTPVAYPDGLGVCCDTTPPTVIVWLFPIMPPELILIEKDGRQAFEMLLERNDPDLFDLQRDSVC